MSRKLNVAVVGVGIGAKHLEAYAELPDCFRVQAVCDLDGDKAGAADAILLWNKAGGKVLAGLTRRRKAERELFLTPVAAHKPTTNPVVSQKSPEVIHKQSNLRKTQTAQPKNADQNPIKKPGWLAMLIRVLAAIFKRKG